MDRIFALYSWYVPVCHLPPNFANCKVVARVIRVTVVRRINIATIDNRLVLFMAKEAKTTLFYRPEAVHRIFVKSGI
jgi:hypothetical protein